MENDSQDKKPPFWVRSFQLKFSKRDREVFKEMFEFVVRSVWISSANNKGSFKDLSESFYADFEKFGEKLEKWAKK